MFFLRVDLLSTWQLRLRAKKFLHVIHYYSNYLVIINQPKNESIYSIYIYIYTRRTNKKKFQFYIKINGTWIFIYSKTAIDFIDLHIIAVTWHTRTINHQSFLRHIQWFNIKMVCNILLLQSMECIKRFHKFQLCFWWGEMGSRQEKKKQPKLITLIFINRCYNLERFQFKNYCY